MWCVWDGGSTRHGRRRIRVWAFTSSSHLPLTTTPSSCLAAGGGLSAATVADLHELRALLVEAKTENEQLKAERDEVGRVAQ